MKFDLTKEISLDENNLKLYQGLRAALYFIALIAATYLAFIVLFPSRFFEFSFNNPDAKSNTISNPRDELRASLDHGTMLADKNSYFDTALSGIFSKAVVSFSLDKKSGPLDSGSITVKKSYEAFLYPEGKTIGFHDGALLKHRGSYYMVSSGELRKFATPVIIPSLGFPLDAFTEVAAEELKYNLIGQPITNNNDYPDFSLFKIDDDYYVLQNRKLKKFISPAAYLSQYEPVQAIGKNENFLTAYENSEEPAGFADGSFISYGDSIYIVSGGNILPIDSPITFLSKGYNWNDVIPASADEISMYEKAKLFTIASQHPDRTIFKTSEDGKYYMIRDKEKHLLPSEKIAKSWLNNFPVSASENSLDITNDCKFKKGFWTRRSYLCEIQIDNMQQLIGSDYEFVVEPSADMKIDMINIEFKKDISWKNFRFTFSEMLNRIKNNYVQPDANQ